MPPLKTRIVRAAKPAPPAVTDPVAAAQELALAQEPAPAPLRLSILVADDDAPTRYTLRKQLELQGHRVATVEDGRQVVEACRAAPPDLVVIDLRMPNLDGLEAARQVSAFAAVPFVVVSCYQDSGVLEHSDGCNVMAYLMKPVKGEDLGAAIRLARARFEQMQNARHETEELRQSLEERKVIERAKGLLVRRARLDEDAAYVALRKVASDHNRKVVEVAVGVIEAEEVFRLLEGL